MVCVNALKSYNSLLYLIHLSVTILDLSQTESWWCSKLFYEKKRLLYKYESEICQNSSGK